MLIVFYRKRCVFLRRQGLKINQNLVDVLNRRPFRREQVETVSVKRGEHIVYKTLQVIHAVKTNQFVE